MASEPVSGAIAKSASIARKRAMPQKIARSNSECSDARQLLARLRAQCQRKRQPRPALNAIKPSRRTAGPRRSDPVTAIKKRANSSKTKETPAAKTPIRGGFEFRNQNARVGERPKPPRPETE